METLRLKNYRKFKDTGDILIKPLTILIGANSSGKSSFLKFFPLIKQTMRRHPNGVFLWYSEDVDFKDFNNTVREGANQIEIEFSVNESWSEFHGLIKVRLIVAKLNEKKDYLKEFYFEVEDIVINIKFPAERNGKLSIYINNKEYSFEGAHAGFIQPIVPLIFFDNGEDRPHTENSPKVTDYLNSVLHNQDNDLLWMIRDAFFNRAQIIKVLRRHKLIKNRGLSQEDLTKIEDYIILYNINRYLESVSYYLLSLASNITYIRPLRAIAERYYRIQNVAIDEIDSHGDNLAMYLYSLDKKERDKFSKWLFDLFKFKIDIEPSGGHVEVKIEENQDKGYKNLVDVGFGYSQMLPILASIWNSLNQINPKRRFMYRSIFRNIPEKFIVIEQPELHLHPRYIAMFAKMILQIIGKHEDKGTKFIIETHSETLVNHIGKNLLNLSQSYPYLSEEDISIVLFNADKEGFTSEIIQTGYDSNGYLNEWPYGFFSGENAVNDKSEEDEFDKVNFVIEEINDDDIEDDVY